MEFNAVMEHSKGNNGPFYTSMSEFYMYSCQCEKSTNAYWKLSCCKGICQACKDANIPVIPYIAELCTNLWEQKNVYLIHRYQIENDKFLWPEVLKTTEKYGSICWLDFSENVSGTPKWEPQDAHFSKQQFLLHCTVCHKQDDGGYDYFYHLSDDTTHDSHYTFAVVEHILSTLPSAKLYRFKSDNCPSQYECMNVFPKWRRLSCAYQKLFITYYGVSGHSKGLADFMSGFGVKEPLRKAIIQEDFFFNSAKDINTYLMEEMKKKKNRKYYLVDGNKLNQRRDNDLEQLKIEDCMKQHMISYFPDGSIEMKENLCICNNCMLGRFASCLIEKGWKIEGCQIEISNGSDVSDESDDDYDDGEELDIGDIREIVKQSGILEVIEPGNYIASYLLT